MEQYKKYEFDNNVRDRLYRSVRDLIRPSISKDNVSNYRIIFKDDLAPVRVFYPTKIASIDGVVIFVPSEGNLTRCITKYSTICNLISTNTNKIVIGLDYFDKEGNYDLILKTVKYLYEEFKNIGIDKDLVTLMGDAIGASYIIKLTNYFINNNLDYIGREVLFYPIISNDYNTNSKYESVRLGIIRDKEMVRRISNYSNWDLLDNDYSKYPETLIINGDLDPLKDEGEELSNMINNGDYLNIIGAGFGFLGSDDEHIKYKYIDKIKEFIGRGE